MIGGVDKTGTDCSNELSYLFLHVIGLLQLSSPTAGTALEQSYAPLADEQSHPHKHGHKGRHSSF